MNNLFNYDVKLSLTCQEITDFRLDSLNNHGADELLRSFMFSAKKGIAHKNLDDLQRARNYLLRLINVSQIMLQKLETNINEFYKLSELEDDA